MSAALTKVTVEQNGHGWWQVRVRYPSADLYTLVSVRTQEEATRAARGYAVLHGWLFEEEDS